MNQSTESGLNIEVVSPRDRLTIFANANGGISIKQVGFDGEVIIAIGLDDLKPLIAGLRLLKKELSK